MQKVQQRRDQEAKVTAQPYEAFVGRQRREARLQGQNVEQDGRHGADRFVLVIVLGQ